MSDVQSSAAKQPNLLILMADQMQSEVLDPGHPCPTPNLDALIKRGVRLTGGYTPNAICSPARASLMTGLMPHNHGVLVVTHTVDEDQSCLRTDKPHWAQVLQGAGYQTGYFGKWHIERSNQLDQFGWKEQGVFGDANFTSAMQPPDGEVENYCSSIAFDGPEGYDHRIFIGVRDDVVPCCMHAATQLAGDFLERHLGEEKPWCCMVSVPEPHDPYICHQTYRDRIDDTAVEIPLSHDDAMADKPGLYRKLRRVFDENLPAGAVHEARCCYYASIAEIDELWGGLLQQIEAAGELDNTIVMVCADHGDALGAHGLFCKNIGAFEESLRIPLVFAGPGIAEAGHIEARLGLQDLAFTLCSLCGEQFAASDGKDGTPLLTNPEHHAPDYQDGFSEYHGGRSLISQRIQWMGDWKLVLNGFDFDELYNLADDPHETVNRIDDPSCTSVRQNMFMKLWGHMKMTGDHSMVNSHYPAMRWSTIGPDVANYEM